MKLLFCSSCRKHTMQLKDKVHRSSCAGAAPSKVLIRDEDLGRAFRLIKKKGKLPVKKRENPPRFYTNADLKNKAEKSLCHPQSKAWGGHIKLRGTKLEGLKESEQIFLSM